MVAKARKAPVPTETQEQLAVVEYLDTVGFDGDVVWTHFRGERAGAYQRILAKKMGVKPKFPDFLFIHKTIHLWIEMKKRGFSRRKKLNAHEIAQIQMHARIRLNGDIVRICETLDEVKRALWFHGFPLRTKGLTSERIRRGFLAAMSESEQ